MSYYNMKYTDKDTKDGEPIYEVGCPDEWQGKKEMTYKEVRRWRYAQVKEAGR